MAGEIITSILHFLFASPGLFFRILGVVLLAASVLLCIAAITYRVRLWWDLRTRGWTVDTRGRNRTAYREIVEGRPEDLVLDCKGERGEYAIYLPSEARWDRTVPAWARGRRTEIVERIRSRLKPPMYLFVHR